jgi:hypothetical protein
MNILFDPIIRKPRRSVVLIQQFYRINSHGNPDLAIVGEEIAVDIPLLYTDENGDWMVNDNFVFHFENEFNQYKETPTYTEALLVVKKSINYDCNLLANDVAEVMYVRYQYILQLALGLVEIEPACFDALSMKQSLYSHMAMICLVTGCFTKAHFYLAKADRYRIMKIQRREYEMNMNNNTKTL